MVHIFPGDKGEHSSYRSNPLIALGFFKAGVIEIWGQGFEKIKDACELAGVPLPRKNGKNFRTPKKKEEHREKLVKHQGKEQGHRYFGETHYFVPYSRHFFSNKRKSLQRFAKGVELPFLNLWL